MAEIEKFDPSKLMDGVKDRIKATFVSLIPEAAWEEMVKAEISRFFNPKVSWNSDREYRSEFQDLVRKEIENECKNRLKEYLSSPDFYTVWENNGLPATTKAVENMIVKNSGEIMVSMFGQMFQSMLINFKNNLQNNRC